MTPQQEYERRKARITEAVKAARGSVALQKPTSNLFRQRNRGAAKRIDVSSLTHVLHVDEKGLLADVEGMTTYETFVRETLKFGLLPTVVPELKSITIGGAVSGVGIESSSFKYGLVHETVEEMEILLPDGATVICSRTKNKDLFFGFPNSYGTLGYALRLKVRLIRAKPYVKLTHTKFTDAKKYFAHIKSLCEKSRKNGHYNYIDGTIFGENEMYVSTGEFVDAAPFVSDYTYLQIYYRSIREKQTDYLTAHDYIWRWDTDWFWCSKNLYAQHKVIRFFATKRLLTSKFYQRIMRMSHKAPLKWLAGGKKKESVIQDVDIPIENAPEYFAFFFKEVGIRPVWVCPVQSFDSKESFDLYNLKPTLHINFGFWDMVPTTHEDGYYNRKVEEKVLELGGKKGLYSSAYYDEQTFWRIYNKKRYDLLKKKYDPKGLLKGLYEKTVKRH